MKRCEGQAPRSTYTTAHQCLKTHGVEKDGKDNLCAHHRGVKSRAGAKKSAGRPSIAAVPKR